MAEERALSAVEEAKRKIRERMEAQGQNGKLPAAAGDKNIRAVKNKPVNEKKKFRQKLKEAVFNEEIGNGNVWDYIFFRIFIPSGKRVLADMGNTAINMALGLDPKTRTIGSGATHTANAGLYRDRNFSGGGNEYTARNRREAVSDFKWDEETAADIYTQCIDILDRYPTLSLAEVYAIMGQQQLIQTTDKRWGWNDARGIDLVCVDYTNRIWRVIFPPARPI